MYHLKGINDPQSDQNFLSIHTGVVFFHFYVHLRARSNCQLRSLQMKVKVKIKEPIIPALFPNKLHAAILKHIITRLFTSDFPTFDNTSGAVYVL